MCLFTYLAGKFRIPSNWKHFRLQHNNDNSSILNSVLILRHLMNFLTMKKSLISRLQVMLKRLH